MKVEFPMPDEHAVRKAISTFLGPTNTLANGWCELLATLLTGLSFSDIEREITAARRDAVVRGKPLEASFHDLVRRRIDALPRAQRGRVGAALIEAGLSQRQVHDITGISRDTIRKATRQPRSTA